MAGKYDHLLDQLPRMLEEESTYQQKIDAVKRKILAEEPKQISHFAAKYAAIRREKDAQKQILSEIELRLTAYEQLLITQFETESTHGLTLEHGDKIRVQLEPYAVVQDREKFRIWCIENGLEKELRLLPQTANALVKERLLEGDPEPDGTRAFLRSKIVFTRG